MGAFEVLTERGFIKQTTHEDEIKKLLAERAVTFYTGFDPTADSLHVGGMLQLMAMAHMQRAGHRPIALVGGGTGMVGDPTDKSDMRRMMSAEEVAANAEAIGRQIARFVDFGEGKAALVNNADWLAKLRYIEFIREYGVHFSVNRMLSADTYRTRFERGLSFFELNYMVMQSYDFLELNRRFGCVLQMGGDDQWSNIIGGVELIRRAENKPAYGMTFTLLTTSDGRKMGKTQAGAVWLDADKTSPYDFYQYWRNIDDADVPNCLRLMTNIHMDEVRELSALKDSAVNAAKERLAYEATALAHGTDEAEKARKAAKAVFAGGGSGAGMPETALSRVKLGEGLPLTEIMVSAKLAPSKAEARRLIEQGGIVAAGGKITDVSKTITRNDFDENGGLIIQKGKKTFHMVKLEG